MDGILPLGTQSSAMIYSTAHDRNIAWEQLASLLCLLSGYQSGCMQRPSLSLKTVEDA